MSLKQLMFKPKVGPGSRARNKNNETNMTSNNVSNRSVNIKDSTSMLSKQSSFDFSDSTESENNNEFASEETVQSIANYLGYGIGRNNCEKELKYSTNVVGNDSTYVASNSSCDNCVSVVTNSKSSKEVNLISSECFSKSEIEKEKEVKNHSSELNLKFSVAENSESSRDGFGRTLSEVKPDCLSLKTNFKPRPGPKIGTNVRPRRISDNLSVSVPSKVCEEQLIIDPLEENKEFDKKKLTENSVTYFKNRAGPNTEGMARSRAPAITSFRPRPGPNVGTLRTKKSDSFNFSDLKEINNIQSIAEKSESLATNCSLRRKNDNDKINSVKEENKKSEVIDSTKLVEIQDVAKDSLCDYIHQNSQEELHNTYNSGISVVISNEAEEIKRDSSSRRLFEMDSAINVSPDDAGREKDSPTLGLINELTPVVLEDHEEPSGEVSLDLTVHEAKDEADRPTPKTQGNIESREVLAKDTIICALNESTFAPKSKKVVLPSKSDIVSASIRLENKKDDSACKMKVKNDSNGKSKTIRNYQKSNIKPKLTVDKLKRPSKFTVSTYGKMNFEVRKNMQKKFENGIPDMSKMTMMDLIFYNPDTSPMTYHSSCETLGDISKDVTEKSQVENTEAVNCANEDLKEEEEKTDAVPVPQLTLSADGKVVVAQDSLKVEQTPHLVTGNYFPTVKKSKTVSERQSWSFEDTVKFYKALKTIGSDFEMMKSVFPERSRRNLKSKFKREEKLHGRLVDKVMTLHSEYDLQTLEKELEEIEELKQIARSVRRGTPKSKPVSRVRPCALPELPTDDCSKQDGEVKANKSSSKKAIASRKRYIDSSESEDEFQDSEEESPRQICIRNDRPRRKVFSNFHLNLIKSHLNKFEETASQHRRVERKVVKRDYEAVENASKERIVINTCVDFQNIKYSKSISYDPNNLNNPIDINETIAH